MTADVLSINDKKTKIQRLLKEDEFIAIIEKPIDSAQGKVIVSKMYAKCNAIIIVEKPSRIGPVRREE